MERVAFIKTCDRMRDSRQLQSVVGSRTVESRHLSLVVPAIVCSVCTDPFPCDEASALARVSTFALSILIQQLQVVTVLDSEL